LNFIFVVAICCVFDGRRPALLAIFQTISPTSVVSASNHQPSQPLLSTLSGTISHCSGKTVSNSVATTSLENFRCPATISNSFEEIDMQQPPRDKQTSVDNEQIHAWGIFQPDSVVLIQLAQPFDLQIINLGDNFYPKS
jgi:hypothetical protein